MASVKVAVQRGRRTPSKATLVSTKHLWVPHHLQRLHHCASPSIGFEDLNTSQAKSGKRTKTEEAAKDENKWTWIAEKWTKLKVPWSGQKMSKYGQKKPKLARSIGARTPMFISSSEGGSSDKGKRDPSSAKIGHRWWDIAVLAVFGPFFGKSLHHFGHLFGNVGNFSPTLPLLAFLAIATLFDTFMPILTI